MAQLEETNKKAHLHMASSGTSDAHSSQQSPLSFHSPVLSPSATDSSYFGADAPSQAATTETNKLVEDWISKARDSLAEFGGLISGGMPKSYIVEADPEDSPSENGSDDERQTAGEYEIAVVSGDESSEEANEGRQTVRHKRSFASSTGSASGTKKKDSAGPSEKLATLPSEAVPFGLMAGLSLRKGRKRTDSVEADTEADTENGNGLGVANDDFFRPSPAPDPARTQIDVGPQAPHILTRGIITPIEAEKLFKM